LDFDLRPAVPGTPQLMPRGQRPPLESDLPKKSLDYRFRFFHERPSNDSFHLKGYTL
jgi:hypothetical protein